MSPHESTTLLSLNRYQNGGSYHQRQLESQKSWDYESSSNRRRWRRIMDMMIGFAACAVLAVLAWSLTHGFSKSRSSFHEPTPMPTPTRASVSDGRDDDYRNSDLSDKKPSNIRASATGSTSKSSISSEAAITATPASKYSKFQALGFSIYTGGAPALLKEDQSSEELVANPECDGMQTFGYKNDFDANVSSPVELWECYLGLENKFLDVEKRLDVMRDAVEAAYEAASKESDTLKVFVAPEFFWRGREGAYVFDRQNITRYGNSKHSGIEDDCTEVCQILMGLEGLVANKKYKNWLFVFGTIIASEPLPTDDKYNYLFYNFAPVYKGYDPKTQDHYGKRYLVPKRFVSNIDFLTPIRQYNGNMTKELVEMTSKQREIVKEKEKSSTEAQNIYPEIVAQEDTMVVGNPWEMIDTQPFYDRDMWYEYKDELSYLGYEMIDYDWLILDNITFTLEVCLDHQMRTALSAYLADNSLGSPTRIPKNMEHWDPVSRKMLGSIEKVKIPRHQAQISIVSSSGMNADPAALALVHNGSLILQDGENGENGTMAFELECDLKSWHFKGGSEFLSRTTNFTDTRIDFNYQIHAPQKIVRIYGNEDHSSDDEQKWIHSIKGIFSAKKYEPLVRVYAPRDVARVDPNPDGKS